LGVDGGSGEQEGGGKKEREALDFHGGMLERTTEKSQLER
jgi:hypothetical protein